MGGLGRLQVRGARTGPVGREKLEEKDSRNGLLVGNRRQKPRQLKKNPGSEIHDADLKRQFYLKMKEWYYSSELRPLTAEEDELQARAGPLVENYPCR